MKQKLVMGIALAVFVVLLLTTCELGFNFDTASPSLTVTSQGIYLSDTTVSFQISFVGEEDKHLCQYSVSKNGGTSFIVLDEKEEELLAGEVYNIQYDIGDYSDGDDDDGHYRFFFSVLIAKNGGYESPPFLQDSVDFWIDTEQPDAPTLNPGTELCDTAFDLEISHPEIPTPSGTTVQIFYTIGSIDSPPVDPDPGEPASGSILYTGPIPIDRNRVVKAIAVDAVGNVSPTIDVGEYTFLAITPSQTLSANKTTLLNYVDVSGHFYDKFDISVYVTDGSAQAPCHIDTIVSSSTNLHLNILGDELTSAGILEGTQTLVVVGNNGDTVSTPITINP